ncbi:MAG: hypothetical protein ACYTF6_08865 [Planctomycetota bacterium]|jgi:hypothetical protein
MAKSDEPSLLEQHIEKGILGVCVIVLIIAVSLWGFSSPRRMRLGNEEVTLDQAGAKTLAEAERKNEEAEDANPPEIFDSDNYKFRREVENLLAKPLRGSLDELEKSWSEITLAVPLVLPPVMPDIQEFPEIKLTSGAIPVPGELPSIAELSEQGARPGKPVINIKRELHKAPPKLPEGIVSHGAVVFPVGEHLKSWRKRLTKRTPLVFAVVAVQVERQERLPDGNWGHAGRPDAAMSITTRMVNKNKELLPAPDYAQLVPKFDGSEESRNTVRNAFQTLENRGFKTLQNLTKLQEILQPEYGEIYWPEVGKFDTWLRHLPENEVTRAAREARQRPRTVERDEGRRGPAPGEWGPFEEEPTPPEIPDWRPTIDHYEETHVREAPPQGPGAAPQMPMVPSIEEQIDNGKLLIWFHDISPQLRKEYRYRLRLVLVNPLLSYVREARTEEDAKQRFLATKWSPWSEGLPVPGIMEMFVTGGWESQNKVNISVFTQRLGQVLLARFFLPPGQAISGEKDVVLIDQQTGKPKRGKLTFDTGSIIVRLDFNKRTARGNKTVEMLYLDENGQLKRTVKVLDMDPASKTYKRYKELEQQAGSKD